MDKIIILFYNGEMPNYSKNQVAKGVLITTDRKYFDIANVVVFYLPDLFFALSDDLDKKDGQFWVAWTDECEENYPFIKSTGIISLFDYWMSYHQDSDIVIPSFDYSCFHCLTEQKPPQNRKNICMLTSSSQYQNMQYEHLKWLTEYIDIDLYKGKYSYEDRIHLYSQYKFVITAEDVYADDYVTKKFFEPLLAGAVPVYLGASNIDDFAPGKNCYVNVLEYNYNCLNDLATHLKACCCQNELYVNYQTWRNFPLQAAFLNKIKLHKTHPFIRLSHLIKKDVELQKQFTAKEYSGNFCLSSFGDSRYSHSRKRLEEQANDFNLFDSIYLYDEHDLSPSFTFDFKEYLQQGVRGFGYWVWKPWVILNSLKKMKDDDILLYIDMGCHLNSNGREKMLLYRDEVTQNNSGFLVTQLEEIRQEYIWTKGDLLDHFQVRDKTSVTHSAQYQGGVIFIRKNVQTVALIQSWLDLFYHHFNLVDDSPSIAHNEDGFREHRHDQSVVSILLKKMELQ